MSPPTATTVAVPADSTIGSGVTVKTKTANKDGQAQVSGLVKAETTFHVDVDSMDPKVARSLIAAGVRPHDMTSNQILVGDGIMDPDNKEMLIQTISEVGSQGWEAVYDRMSVLLCKRNLPNVSNRVLLQTSPSDAYDTDKIVAHARKYAAEFERIGISKDRFCIKIPATGPGMNAGPILLKDGIRTLGTSLFSVPQAIASAQAGCLYISPYFNEVKAHDPATGLFPNVRSPATQHPMSPRMVQIYNVYRHLAQTTGKPQPLIKGASNITAAEVLGMAKMGVHHVTILQPVLKQLSELAVPVEQELEDRAALAFELEKFDEAKPYSRELIAEMQELEKVDPLSPTKVPLEWGAHIDYLADGGKELEKAIEADPQTKRRLDDALNLFIDAEHRARDAILAAMKTANV